MDLMEQQQNLYQIQHVDNELNTLFEEQSIANKEFYDIWPVIQKVYMQMHQFDATTYSKWNLLIVSKTKECSKEVTQQFIAKASLLAKKWQDKFGNFQRVKERALELVSELGPSFEEVK